MVRGKTNPQRKQQHALKDRPLFSLGRGEGRGDSSEQGFRPAFLGRHEARDQGRRTACSPPQ